MGHGILRGKGDLKHVVKLCCVVVKKKEIIENKNDQISITAEYRRIKVTSSIEMVPTNDNKAFIVTIWN